MLLLLLLVSLFGVVHGSCPQGFDLVRNGECRGRYFVEQPLFYDQAANYVVAKCAEIQGQPIIIHDDEHQTYWADHVNLPPVIGLTCNNRSMQWEWADGSPVDYKPSVYDRGLDEACTSGCAWTIQFNGYWILWCGHTEQIEYDIWCTTQLEPAAKACDNFSEDSEDSACYHVSAITKNFHDAQNVCRNLGANLASIHNAQENSFVRRLAVSKGAVHGVFLGATSSGKANAFTWLDGSDWDYENFVSGPPDSDLGDCLSMDTRSVAGEWSNTNCSCELAVACLRQPYAANKNACSQGPWKEGEMIYSPGYPYDASVGCDYFLSVEAGKRVEVKIHSLEANSCCDHLIISDSYLGGRYLNVTGNIIEKTITISSSNVVRVSWQPNGGVNVRGLMMSFRGV